MMVVALSMRPALDLLWQNCGRLSEFKLNTEEWSLVDQIHQFLRNFEMISTALGGEHYATLPLVIVAFNLLLNRIESTVTALDKKPDPGNVDEILLLAFQTGRDKMLKHYHKTNWLYCTALIIDSRHKVDTFLLTQWGAELKDASLDLFEKIYREKY